MNGNDFRMFYEEYCRQKLATHLNVLQSLITHSSKNNGNSPFDLEAFGKKYDVKTSNPTIEINKTLPVWVFDLRKSYKNKRIANQKKHCDYYILLGLYQAIPKGVFLLPYEKAPISRIRVSIFGETKYNQFKI